MHRHYVCHEEHWQATTLMCNRSTYEQPRYSRSMIKNIVTFLLTFHMATDLNKDAVNVLHIPARNKTSAFSK